MLKLDLLIFRNTARATDAGTDRRRIAPIPNISTAAHGGIKCFGGGYFNIARATDGNGGNPTDKIKITYRARATNPNGLGVG